MNCRLCWERLQLEAGRVERLDPGAYAYRCQECECSFLLRLADVIELGLEPEPASASSAPASKSH